ncbi:hypothetical protein BpHYR1_000872 [Brachionus plicatilis]|uniref:Uncharacterized protein n=1 Tax=Brachionus plicatilis TaxID=10195 RepID=A0A3M7R8W2_BRAPC|nr:hypothetical protein BpHYR1_000872 [Brachionus plicatilis]
MPSKNALARQQIKLLCQKVKYRSKQRKNKYDRRKINEITRAVLLDICFQFCEIQYKIIKRTEKNFRLNSLFNVLYFLLFFCAELHKTNNFLT